MWIYLTSFEYVLNMLDRVITKYQTKDEEAKIKWIKQSDILKQFLPLCSFFFFLHSVFPRAADGSGSSF